LAIFAAIRRASRAGEEFSEIFSEQQLSQISEPYELCRPVLALPLRCNAGRDDSQYGC
jgi:hypothetical protein